MTSVKYGHLQVMGTKTGKFHRNPLKTIRGVPETRLCLWIDEPINIVPSTMSGTNSSLRPNFCQNTGESTFFKVEQFHLHTYLGQNNLVSTLYVWMRVYLLILYLKMHSVYLYLLDVEHLRIR